MRGFFLTNFFSGCQPPHRSHTSPATTHNQHTPLYAHNLRAIPPSPITNPTTTTMMMNGQTKSYLSAVILLLAAAMQVRLVYFSSATHAISSCLGLALILSLSVGVLSI